MRLSLRPLRFNSSRVIMVILAAILAVMSLWVGTASAGANFLTRWGTGGSNDGEFNFPFEVAADSSGNVYVAGTFNNRIQESGCDTPEVYFTTKWGTSGTGDGEFNNPFFVAVNAGGDVYVSDRGNSRIQKFTSAGAFTTKWGSAGLSDGQFNNPYGVAIDSAGNVYVADSSNDRIQKFTSAGAFITEWGSAGSNPGEFALPIGVAVDSSDNVYVAETGNDRIQKFTSTGVFITEWGTNGTGDVEFDNPIGVAVDSTGNVYVADSNNNQVKKFSSAGTFITKWGRNDLSTGTGDGEFNNPNGVAVDAAGDVYVADYGNSRIQKFTSAGTFIIKWGGSGSGDGQFINAAGVAVDSAGNVYVADTFNNRVQKFDQTGAPVANAGADQNFSCVKTTQAVTLDGTASSDPTPGDAATLSYAWSEGTTVLGTGATLNVNLAPGTHTITLAVTDDCLHSSTDTVTIEVEAYNSVDCNTAPDAVDDAPSVAEDSGANSIDVLSNDTDYDSGDPKTITAKTDGAHGAVAITGGGTGLTYTPAANFHGSDTFTYTISDGRGGTDTADVSVTVTSVNDPPTDIALSASSVPDNSPSNTTVGTLSTTDADGNTFTYTLVDGAGSSDNNSFSVAGSTLKTAALFDFETKPVHSLRVRSTDAGGGFFEKQFLVTVTDGADTPGSVAFSQASYNADETAGDATITVKRTGGTHNPVVAKVSLTDVTTSAADYRFAPGSADASFTTGTGAAAVVWSVAAQADGRVLIGGDFLTYNGTARTRIARLNADGTLDATFNPGAGANGIVYAIAPQPDGRILIGGAFTTYDGTARSHIARLNSDGTLDTSFDPGAGTAGGVPDVRAILLQPDGKVIIGGDFSTPRGRVARLHSDGSLDTTFIPTGHTGASGGANTGVYTMALQPDGKLVIAGGFTGYDGNAIGRLARLNSDGTLDGTFNTGTGVDNSIVWGVAVQPDGKIIVGGNFGSFNGAARNRLIRVNTDGTLDATFNPVSGPNGVVWTTSLQPDGKVIVCGNFTLYDGVSRGRIARANADGTLDTTFVPGAGATSVILTATPLQPDGKIIVGGSFTAYSGQMRARVARVNGDLFVTWPAGDATDKTIQLPIINDGVNETPDETLNLALAVMSGGAALGSPNAAVLTILDPNDGPVNTVPAAQTTGENTPKVFSSGGGNQISIDDADAGSNSVRVTLTATKGTITLSGTGGLSFLTGDGAADAASSFTGAVANINAALNGLSFKPALNYSGAAALQIVTNDQGSTGAGGAKSDTDAVSITVNEGGVLKLSASTYSVGETAGTMVINITRTGGSGGAATVKYATTNGTAAGFTSCAAGKDYVTQTGTLSWADGDMANKTFTIPVCDDAVYEGNETVNLTLSNATGGAILSTPRTAVLTIVDNETQPKLSVNSVTVTEGNTSAVSATFVVTLSGPSSKSVTVKYATSNATAVEPADYTALPLTTLTFSPGQTTKNVNVSVKGDLVDELDETFKLTLSAPTNATIATGLGTGVGAIKDNDDAKISINNVSVTEPDTGTIAMTFTVKLSVASSRTVSVKYQTANGTATAPADYAAKALQPLSFSPGVTTMTVTITVNGELVKEPNETLFVNLSAPVNATISDSQGQGTIINDD